MTPRYAVRFPTLDHLDRFKKVLAESPSADALRKLLEALGDDPRPASLGYESVPPEDEARLLLSSIGYSLPGDSFSHAYRAVACCRIEAFGYEVLYDVMDDLKIIWLFQIRPAPKAGGGPGPSPKALV